MSAAPHHHHLFVCGQNKKRSPTAERIFRHLPHIAVRSCGVSPKARRRLTEADLNWADTVWVMEARHRQRIEAEFPEAAHGMHCVTLDIPDEHEFMDPDLIAELKAEVGPHLAS